MITNSPILWSVSFRAICHQGLVQGRARGALVPQNASLNRTAKILAPAYSNPLPANPFGNVIAAMSSRGSALARGLKRIISLSRIASGLFLQENAGTYVLGFCNFRRLPATAGKCLSPRSLIKPLQKSLSVLGILRCPFHSAEPLCLGLIARSDGHRVAKGNGHVRHETGQF